MGLGTRDNQKREEEESEKRNMKHHLREDVGKNYDLDLLLLSARSRKNDVTSDVCWRLSVAHDWESRMAEEGSCTLKKASWPSRR